MAKVIIGLGNPGKTYEKTRHNVGFLVVDALSKRMGIPVTTTRFKGHLGEGMINGQKVVLLKPQTYMNLSGESVRELLDWYKVDVSDIVIIYDDMDLPVGQLRLRLKGSAGGHNGVKSIILHTNTDEIKRIKVGISRPPAGWKVPDYVLSKFTNAEELEISQTINRAVEAVEEWLDTPFEKVMNKYN